MSQQHNIDMTQEDKNRLFMTLDEIVRKQKAQDVILSMQSDQLAKLEQGMFGDIKLKQDGLIQDMIFVKDWISKNKLRTAYLTGIITTVFFGIKTAIDWLVGKK